MLRAGRESFPAEPEALEEVQPGEGPLDDPAAAAESGAVFGLAPGDDWLHASRPERAAVLVVVIATVGDQFLGAPAGASDLSPNGFDPVDEGQKLGDVVAVVRRPASGMPDGSTRR